MMLYSETRVENLLGYPIDSYKGDWKGFYYILIGSERELYSILIKSEKDDINVVNDAFISAADDGNYLAVKVLLSDQRVDPSAGDNYAIQMASLKGRTEVVQLILADKRRETKV